MLLNRVSRRAVVGVLVLSVLSLLALQLTSHVKGTVWTSASHSHDRQPQGVVVPDDAKNGAAVEQFSVTQPSPEIRSLDNMTAPGPTGKLSLEVSEALKSRRQRVEEVCRRRGSQGRVQGVFVNRDKQLAYCFVPKTGCTFWKQLFGFLNKDTGMKTPVRSPFDIPRLLIHLTKNTNGWPWAKVKAEAQSYLRFMFARDPYSRLWSSYLDKFYLPDFWTKFGSKVMAKARPPLSPQVAACGNNVTFAQFLDFALDFNEPHWTPVSASCDPCQFRPEIVGTTETYTRDARAVLDRVGLGWILEEVDHAQHVRNELEMLVKYNFQVIHTKTPVLLSRGCTSEQEIGRRLWRTFQLNGYISEKVAYNPPEPFNEKSFTGVVLDAFEASKQYGKDSLKAQKKRLFEDAFRQLPERTLQRIAAKYEVDFEMFGYSPRTFQ